jgi:hypothetical protein
VSRGSYLAGPGFVGVREMMRRTFDELWIIDLGGDNLGTRKTPNVFNIQTPVAIALGVRAAKPSPLTSAKVRYVKVDGSTREDKLMQLEGLAGFGGMVWRDCPDDWQKPLLPIGKGDFFQWPPISDIFPYQRSGSKLGRPWPIGETRELIQNRWDKLLSVTGAARAKLFKNNKYRKIERKYRDHRTGDWLPTLASVKAGTQAPQISAYAFRPFDRHFVFEDTRFNDRMGDVLWLLQCDKQLYLTSLATEALGLGQALLLRLRCLTSIISEVHLAARM